MAAAAMALLLGGASAIAQPAPAPLPTTTAPASPAHLDDLLAPIALYPDPLLSQILMAASYPVEVVEADRWLADPGNAALRGGELAAVVNQQAWDPSVKSLVPFPRVLAMMDNHLEWTRDLGDAFVADPAAVMDAVQDLRRRAMAAGALRGAPDLTVNQADGVITILPAAPQEVYYPAFVPADAYGPWPYPDSPPYAFDDTYDAYDAYDGCAPGAFGSCWFGVAVVLPLWGWQHCDWRHHRIRIDPDRFAALNNQRRPSGGAVWVPERDHRHGVAYPDAGLRARYPSAARGLPDRGLADLPARSYPHRAGTDAPGGQVMAAPRGPLAAPPQTFFERGPDGRTPVERAPGPRVFAPAAPQRVFAPPPRAAPAPSPRSAPSPAPAPSQNRVHP